MAEMTEQEIRLEACRLAARIMQGKGDEFCPVIWSLCVFFEKYIVEGSGATAKDFGPKKPVKLKTVKRGS